jgi:hypothetical protein
MGLREPKEVSGRWIKLRSEEGHAIVSILQVQFLYNNKM